jgi:beta-N-acetylhexosaminidase
LREALRLAGQRFLFGFDGLEVSPDCRTLIRDFGAGNVILFGRNVDAPEQVAELVRELQSVARDAGHELPLLVGVDQEGGRVARLGKPWTRWPPLRALGRADSEDLARRVGEALAAELGACGIRWDFAPVVDVDTNPDNPVIGDRSFGPDPERVATLGAALVRGLQSSGVAACAKHFPGHGDTALDSHLELPVVEHPRSRLDEVELRPFRAAVEAGVASVMTGHLLLPELDAERPATLSRALLGGVLRDELGFLGLVVSDDLEMKAVAARWPAGERALLAAEAGCDVLASCASPEDQVAGIEALVRGLESGRVPWKACEDAAARVRAAKERYLLPYADPKPALARAAAGGEARWALAEEIAARSGVMPA